MLSLRPHHILDMVRNIGNGRKIEPHPYGHLLHIITRSIIDDVNQECTLVVRNDDICGPCIHLHNGQCDDILPQLTDRVSKQGYNDKLDKEILEFIELEENTIMKISDYLTLIKANIEDIVGICTHPKEDKGIRRIGLEKVLKILGIE